MAGGIYADQPFVFNPKCVIFGAALCAAYWYLPASRNPWMLPFIFVVAYVAMAWYDHAYDCRIGRLRSGTSPVGVSVLDSAFKPDLPADLPDDGMRDAPDQDRIKHRNTFAFHVAVVAPMLIYVGLRGASADRRIWAVVLGLGVLALAYHGYRLMKIVHE